MSKPLVTILMPVFNAEKYLEEAITSVLAQTYSNYEFLIINDGSTDRSEEIIRSFDDNRIRLVNNELNLKLIATLNKGIELSRGQYIARMDADDISLPERIERQVSFLEQHPEVGVCGTWFKMFGQREWLSKYPVTDPEIRLMLLYQSPFCHPSVLIRRSILEESGVRFDKEYLHAEDFDFWARLSRHTLFANIPEFLLSYRMHEEGVSQAFHDIQIENTYKIINRQFGKVGVTMDTDKIDLYINIAHSTFKADKKYVMMAERLLTAIVQANNRTKYIPIDVMNSYVGERWFHLCTNTTELGLWIYRMYKNSTLTKFVKVGRTEEIKMLIKSIIPTIKNRKSER